MSARATRGRNPLIVFIYLVFVWPAYLFRGIVGLFFKILAWIGSLAEKLTKDGVVKRMHARGGFSGFLAVLVDLAMAAFIWAFLLLTLNQFQDDGLFGWIQL